MPEQNSPMGISIETANIERLHTYMHQKHEIHSDDMTCNVAHYWKKDFEFFPEKSAF